MQRWGRLAVGIVRGLAVLIGLAIVAHLLRRSEHWRPSRPPDDAGDEHAHGVA
jgi:hypothetical protein